MLVVLRSPSAQVVVSLSGMAQLVGYSMAACGPFIVGLLRDLTGGWNAAAVFFVVVDLAALAVGVGAGRRMQVQAKVQPLL
jgi:CP family cyanate transporter-like MFS transporter